MRDLPNSNREMTTRPQWLAFGFLCALSIAAGWHSLTQTLALALHEDAYTHILLILPLSLALVYLHLATAQTNSCQTDSHEANSQRTISQSTIVSGIAVLAVSGLLIGLGRWGQATMPAGVPLALTMAALVVWWIGSVLLCFGVDVFRALLFPVCFLFLLVPLPGAMLNEVVSGLQHQSAFAARILFRVIDVPATQDGIMLSIPGLDIEVAPECSSIRSSMMLLVVTLVLAHLFLRSWWCKGVLIVAAIPLSIAKNGLRIFTIGELGTRVDPGFLDGRLHHHGGIIFFGIAVIAISAVLLLLRLIEFPLRERPRAT